MACCCFVLLASVAIFRPCGFSLFTAFLPCFLFFVFPFLASVRSFLLRSYSPSVVSPYSSRPCMRSVLLAHGPFEPGCWCTCVVAGTVAWMSVNTDVGAVQRRDAYDGWHGLVRDTS